MKRHPEASLVASELRAHIRRLPQGEDADFVHAPEPLSGGADKDVFAFEFASPPPGWDGPLVLKLFAEDDDAARVRLEATMQHAVSTLGFPAPGVLEIGDGYRVAGGHFIIMRRVPGQSLFERLKRPSPAIFRLTPTLADLHLRLHALDAGQALAQIEAGGVDDAAAVLSFEHELRTVERRVAEAKLDELGDAVRWLRDHAPAEPPRLTVCHGDFHMSNVIVNGDAVSGVVDWSVSRIADPAYDVARTILLIRCGRIEVPAPLRPVMALLRRSLGFRFTRIYRRARTIDDAALSYYTAFHALRSFGMGYEAALISPVAFVEHPWASADVARALAAQFRAQTGLRIARSQLGE